MPRIKLTSNKHLVGSNGWDNSWEWLNKQEFSFATYSDFPDLFDNESWGTGAYLILIDRKCDAEVFEKLYGRRYKRVLTNINNKFNKIYYDYFWWPINASQVVYESGELERIFKESEF